jgi:hypothetical protein
MTNSMRIATAAGLVAAAAWCGLAVVRSQQPAKPQTSPQAIGKFEFEVIESFDAKYEGDTPGHIGRSGGLGDDRPQAALGDAVYRGEQKIGAVTALRWSRGQGSLEVEFDPQPKTRINVGDVVWLKLGAAN